GFGTYKNIVHAKDVLALLFLQSGNRFIDVSSQGEISVHFGATAKNTETTIASKALDFYLSFSNPVNPLYTWNEGFSSDREMFIQNSLAYYFGYASELPFIRSSNPNLNFSLTTPPQFVKGTTRTTGTIYGIAIPKTAKNQALSYSVASTFANKTWSEMLVANGGSNFAFSPARRDVLSQKPTSDPYKALIYDSALVFYPWTDPNPRSTDPIFRQLISSITSGVLTTYQALLQTGGQLQSIGANI
nr:hypothetical protein [Candidatus Paceibacterota bacterium]